MFLKAIKSWVCPFIVWDCKVISLNEMGEKRDLHVR